MTDWVSICTNLYQRVHVSEYIDLHIYLSLVCVCVLQKGLQPFSQTHVTHPPPKFKDRGLKDRQGQGGGREGNGQDGRGGVRRGQAGANLSLCLLERWILRRTSQCGLYKFKTFLSVNQSVHTVAATLKNSWATQCSFTKSLCSFLTHT